MPLETAVLVEGLRKNYGRITAVDGINLQVPSASVFGMLGPNGAGKTTTVEVLVGILPRDGGYVEVLGTDPAKNPRYVKANIGVQLQTAALYPRLTVRETLELFAAFYAEPLPIGEVIVRIGLESKANTRVDALSGGQRQRLSVGLAMVSNARLIFLDEPTTGLDPHSRRNLWDVILQLKAEGTTVFLTTHYMEEAEMLCDNVAVVDKGRVVAAGSPQSLIDKHFLETAVELGYTQLPDLSLIEGLPGVTRVGVQEDKNRLVLYTQRVAETVAALLEQGQQSIPGDDIHVRRATLEDVFLKLTGRTIEE